MLLSVSNQWPAFFVDFNSWGWGVIPDARNWRSFIARAEEQDAAALERILSARGASLHRHQHLPTFGYRREHTSEMTLEAWGLSKGTDLRAAARAPA